MVVEIDADVSEIEVRAAAIGITAVEAATFYDRDAYQPDGWSDVDGDCLNGRHEVLVEESAVEVTFDPTGCFVETGLWTDSYDGKQYTDAEDVSIDHVIALAHAHRNGAWAWDLDTKQAFAEDLLFAGSLAVVGAETNQSKSDLSPAAWRPQLRSAWCGFAADWVNGKQRWALTYESAAERDAVAEMLATCGVDGELRPDQVSGVGRAPVATSTTTSSTTTTVVLVGQARARIVDCDERSELVTIINDGLSDLDLGGFVLHDDGAKHRYHFPAGLVLSPGQQVMISSGPDARSGSGIVLWQLQNVWNNDGDTAHLVAPDGSTVQQEC